MNCREISALLVIIYLHTASTAPLRMYDVFNLPVLLPLHTLAFKFNTIDELASIALGRDSDKEDERHSKHSDENAGVFSNLYHTMRHRAGSIISYVIDLKDAPKYYFR